jgi:integrase
MDIRQIDSVAKRARLPVSPRPVWVAVGAKRGGISLGYRKLTNGPGVWILKVSKAGGREEHRIGDADDADSQSCALSYSAALGMALDQGARLIQSVRHEQKIPQAVSKMTLADGIAKYIHARKQRNEKYGRDAEASMKLHLLSNPIATARLATLNRNDWLKWRNTLPVELKARSIKRILSDVKAAMHMVWKEHFDDLPPNWQVNYLKGLAAPQILPSRMPRRKYPTDEEVARIIEAAFKVDEDFGRLIVVLVATGCRLSQAQRMRVGDVYDGNDPYLMIPVSGKGKRNPDRPPETRFPIGSDIIEVLCQAIEGRGDDEILLECWHWRKPTTYRREWHDIDDRWAESLSLAGVPYFAPYRLRDRSIMNMIRDGVPITLVAKLHNTSVDEIMKAYARDIDDVLAKMARATVKQTVPSSLLRRISP